MIRAIEGAEQFDPLPSPFQSFESERFTGTPPDGNVYPGLGGRQVVPSSLALGFPDDDVELSQELAGMAFPVGNGRRMP